MRGSLTILQEPEPFVERVIVDHSRTHNGIGMAVHVLGERVDGDVGAQLEGPLKVRRQEGVIYDHNDLEKEWTDID